MLDIASKWQAEPDWAGARLEGRTLRVSAISGIVQRLISGDVERFLESEGFDVEQLRADAKTKADALAKQLRAGAIAIQPDPAEQMFDNVYSSPHARIERQRAEYKAFAASYEKAAS